MVLRLKTRESRSLPGLLKAIMSGSCKARYRSSHHSFGPAEIKGPPKAALMRSDLAKGEVFLRQRYFAQRQKPVEHETNCCAICSGNKRQALRAHRIGILPNGKNLVTRGGAAR